MIFRKCKILNLVFVTIFSCCALAPISAHAVNIEVTVTVDNVYGIYWGTETEAQTFVAANNDWYSAETYSFDLPSDKYIYVVCYTDDYSYQGFLAQFTNNDEGYGFYSNDTEWEVAATGIDKDTNSPQPTLNELTEQIKLANAGANPSLGWVDTTVGAVNGSSPWGSISGVDSSAHWVWYDSYKDSSSSAPFTGFDHDEYLIFRIWVGSPEPTPIPEPTATPEPTQPPSVPTTPPSSTVPEPATWLLVSGGLLGMAALLRKRRKH